VLKESFGKKIVLVKENIIKEKMAFLIKIQNKTGFLEENCRILREKICVGEREIIELQKKERRKEKCTSKKILAISEEEKIKRKLSSKEKVLEF
jgi:hypothetical protein